MRKPKRQKPSNVVDMTLVFYVRGFSNNQLERALWHSRLTDSMCESEGLPVIKTALDVVMEEEYSRRVVSRMEAIRAGYGIIPPIHEEEVGVVLPFRSNHG